MAKPWMKLKGIIGDDSSSRKDFIKRMQHRTPPSGIHALHSTLSSSTTTAGGDNYYSSSSPHSNNSPTGSQHSIHHTPGSGGRASSPGYNNMTSTGGASPHHHHDYHRDSNSSGIGLVELVSDFAGGGAVSIPFFIPPTRFGADSARSSITDGRSSHTSSPHGSPRSGGGGTSVVQNSSSSKKWQKLRMISSLAVRPPQAYERRSSVDTRGGELGHEGTGGYASQGAGSGGKLQSGHHHHDKLRKLRQRPTQFELQVPSLASHSASAAAEGVSEKGSTKTTTEHQQQAVGVPVSGVLFRHTSSSYGGASSGPSTRMHSPKKQQQQHHPTTTITPPFSRQQQAGGVRASPAKVQQQHSSLAVSSASSTKTQQRVPIVAINIEPSPPSINDDDGFGSQQQSHEPHHRHRQSPSKNTRETTGGGSPRSSVGGGATMHSKGEIEPENELSVNILGVNTTDSRIRRQSCESKYWDCPEAPAQSLLLKIPQRDTMYQRRRSSTFGNLNDLLNGIDTTTAAAAETASAAPPTSPTITARVAAGGSASPSTSKRTTTLSSSSPSNSPAPVLRRRPTAAALLGGSSENVRSAQSSAGPATVQGGRQRTRHLSVTHVLSSELPDERRTSAGRQQSVSPHRKFSLSPAGGGNSGNRQISISAENLADMTMLDDGQIALLKAESQAIATRGEVKIALVYMQEEKTLKATVYKAENLGKNRRDITSYVAACLLPGKQQKQQSRLIKSNKNPQYDEEFYFPGHRWHELTNMILRISIYNQLTVGKECLGEVLIPLGTVDEPTVEQRMWRDLRPKLQNPMQDNAFIQLRLCFNAGVRKVILTVMKVHNVRGAVTFLPDVYVKVEFWQNHKQLDKRSTKVAKRTNNPVFKEAFAFQLSTTKEEMSFTTIKVTLVAKAAIGSDGPVGQVILGYGATEDTENEQWRNAIRDPGKEFTRWHALLPVD